MEFDPTSLDARKQHAIAHLPPPHLLPPQENELFSSWEEAKARLQDYAFTQGFALVTETHDKKNHLIVLDCTRHHKRVRNTRKVEEEDRVRANTKVSFNECPYRLRLKKNKDNAWRLIVTNSEPSMRWPLIPLHSENIIVGTLIEQMPQIKGRVSVHRQPNMAKQREY